MTINEIATEFTWGSTGFVRAIETHCGLGASRSEIERIAARASTPEEFMAIWEDEDGWTDANAA